MFLTAFYNTIQVLSRHVAFENLKLSSFAIHKLLFKP